MKVKVTCNNCKKIYSVEENTKTCPNCKKPLKRSYKHKYSQREDTHLGNHQRRKQVIRLEFHHILYTFILGLALYIGVLVADFNGDSSKNKISSNSEALIKKNNKQLTIPNINVASRTDEVFKYFQYISKEIDYLNRLQNSIEGQPGEGDLGKIRDIIFKISLKIEEMSGKKVPTGYDNIQLNFKKNLYSKEKYFQSYYDYILSKDPKYIEKINNSIQEQKEVWTLVLDDLETEMQKDGFSVYRREDKISVSYEKVKYGF